MGQIRKNGEPRKKRKLTPEHIAKIIAAKIANGTDSYNKQPKSEETKAKMSAAKKGRKLPWLESHYNRNKKPTITEIEEITSKMSSLDEINDYLVSIGSKEVK